MDSKSTLVPLAAICCSNMSLTAGVSRVPRDTSMEMTHKAPAAMISQNDVLTNWGTAPVSLRLVGRVLGVGGLAVRGLAVLRCLRGVLAVGGRCLLAVLRCLGAFWP